MASVDERNPGRPVNAALPTIRGPLSAQFPHGLVSLSSSPEGIRLSYRPDAAATASNHGLLSARQNKIFVEPARSATSADSTTVSLPVADDDDDIEILNESIHTPAVPQQFNVLRMKARDVARLGIDSNSSASAIVADEQGNRKHVRLFQAPSAMTPASASVAPVFAEVQSVGGHPVVSIRRSVNVNEINAEKSQQQSTQSIASVKLLSNEHTQFPGYVSPSKLAADDANDPDIEVIETVVRVNNNQSATPSKSIQGSNTTVTPGLPHNVTFTTPSPGKSINMQPSASFQLPRISLCGPNMGIRAVSVLNGSAPHSSNGIPPNFRFASRPQNPGGPTANILCTATSIRALRPFAVSAQPNNHHPPMLVPRPGLVVSGFAPPPGSFPQPPPVTPLSTSLSSFIQQLKDKELPVAQVKPQRLVLPKTASSMSGNLPPPCTSGRSLPPKLVVTSTPLSTAPRAAVPTSSRSKASGYHLSAKQSLSQKPSQNLIKSQTKISQKTQPLTARIEQQGLAGTVANAALSEIAHLIARRYARSKNVGRQTTPSDEYVKMFKCSWSGCNRRVSNNVSLVSHLYAHYLRDRAEWLHLNETIAESASCRQCRAEFVSPYELENHVKMVHRKQLDVLACYICETTFKDVEQLRQHMFGLHHENETPYVCGVCKVFKSSLRSDVMVHFGMAHTGTLSLMCPICFIEFRSKVPRAAFKPVLAGAFCTHMEKHIEQRNFSFDCTKCKLSFLKQRDLGLHFTRHYPSQNNSQRTSGISNIACDGIRPKPLEELHKAKLPSRRLLRPVESQHRIPTLEESNCLECQRPMDSAKHFNSFVTTACPFCRGPEKFQTSCATSFVNHVSTCRALILPPAEQTNLFRRREVVLDQETTCECGFSTIFGNKMAAHLTSCSGKAYCGPQPGLVASSPPSVVTQSAPDNFLRALGLVQKGQPPIDYASVEKADDSDAVISDKLAASIGKRPLEDDVDDTYEVESSKRPRLILTPHKKPLCSPTKAAPAQTFSQTAASYAVLQDESVLPESARLLLSRRMPADRIGSQFRRTRERFRRIDEDWTNQLDLMENSGSIITAANLIKMSEQALCRSKSPSFYPSSSDTNVTFNNVALEEESLALPEEPTVHDETLLSSPIDEQVLYDFTATEENDDGDILEDMGLPDALLIAQQN